MTFVLAQSDTACVIAVWVNQLLLLTDPYLVLIVVISLLNRIQEREVSVFLSLSSLIKLRRGSWLGSVWGVIEMQSVSLIKVVL